MEVFLECCMTLFFSAAMLLLGIFRIAVLNRSGFLMFFYITGAMLSYTAMVFAMPHKKEQISRQQA